MNHCVATLLYGMAPREKPDKDTRTHPEAFAGVVIIHVELAFALVITSCIHAFLNFLLLLKKTTENI